MIPRRSFLKTTAGAGALAAFGGFEFLTRLPAVAADEVKLDPAAVRFNPEIEPLVRLLEDTPRERVLEEVAARIKRGLSYQQVLAALMLAGVRSIQPRPVGFKFHAVLVVNSAHLASIASPDSERWLPIFWAIDQFKSSQAADVREGNWTMPPVDEGAVPAPDKARAAFIQAMDCWDEAAADVAIVGLARNAGAGELFELFSRYGARDFRDIGHKAIYVANSFRCLEVIGWHHAEPVLRSLAYALLDRSGARENPGDADLAPDRPFRKNIVALRELRGDWPAGKRDPEATAEMLRVIRSGSAEDASALVIQLVNRGASPQSIFDGIFSGAGELLMRAPGIIALHAMTTSNAMHYAWNRTQSDETRRLLLLQNAAFLPLFRAGGGNESIDIQTLEPLAPSASGDAALAEIFADIDTDRLTAARKVLGYLQAGGSHLAFSDAARRLIFLKGTNSHDYKFSSAVLEDYAQISPEWRDRMLASTVFYLRGSGQKDNGLVQRTRAALA